MVGMERAAEGGNAAAPISAKVRKTIQSIKEIVGYHSDADIYAALKESNMDPNETAQKLLNQDPFHEVKRRRDRKKENESLRNANDMRKPTENNIQFSRSYGSWDRNARRSGFQRNSGPDTKASQQFRVVRDNRQNQSAYKGMGESSQNPAPSSIDTVSNVQQKSKHTSGTNMEGQTQRTYVSSDSISVPVKDTHQICSPALDIEKRSAPLATTSKPQRQAHINPEPSTTSVATGSDVGVYSSSTDPIHVPTTVSRPSGTVGAIRREVGIFGGRGRSSARPVVQQSVDASAATEPFRQSSGASKNNQLTLTSVAESTLPDRSHSNYTSRQHQQSVNHQKAAQLNMEWKPKSSQKHGTNNPAAEGTDLRHTATCVDNSGGLRIGDVTILSEKLAEVNVSTNLHVIIPQHLRVPEPERAGLMFGSFGNKPGSFKVSEPTQTYEKKVDSSDEPSRSVSASVPPGSNNDMPDDQDDHVDPNTRVLRSDSPTSGAESELPPPESCESPGQHTESFVDIGTRHNHSSAYDSPDTQQLNGSNLPGFSADDHQEDMPFYRTAIEDNIHGQDFPAQSESMTPLLTSALSAAAMVQQQQQQQQAMAQMYQQVHISHLPNFVPYRHIFSPVYMPPMAVPNYSNNPAYPHPSSGNSYVLMPGGSSHLTCGGMKYAASQYKPVPAGSPTAYGAYTNPAGFAVGAPGTTVGTATGLEDVPRIKYKDSNLYVPSPQADASDIWVQTPRELPSLQSPTPFYSMSCQTSHAAFVSAHAGSFNATAAPPVQYPSLYHLSQSGSMANPHHLVHQQVSPAIGGNVGVGVAAPGTQVGTYHQPQLGHLNWTTNF